MTAKEICARVRELAQQPCEEAGVSIWDVEFENEGGVYTLTVYIDCEDGADIDQCELVSRAIDPMLDAKEFDSMPSYTLCVSSAGLERKLTRQEHFLACIGKEVEARFYAPVGGRKSAEGTLAGYDKETGEVTIETQEGARTFKAQDIALVRLLLRL